ncbi:YehR family protein [Streptococcus marimammalium]|uniref:YehR family protein n=1 Tax=Streptococcus marimammalium TaxID=269666 RepID=UPI000360A73F|nr:YehR family protein [Streptococcus marimammalium]
MKKRNLIFSLLLMLSLVILAACGKGINQNDSNKEKSVSYFQSSQPGIDIRMTFYYDEKKDIVLKQETNTQLSYAAIGVSTAEEAKKYLNPITSQYEGIDGVTDQIEYGEEHVVEYLVMDYEKIDLKDLANIPGLLSSNFEDPEYISYKQTLEFLKKSKFKEVKDGKFKEFQPLNQN